MSEINLVEIIKTNPGCVALVGNGCWELYRKHPIDNPEIVPGPICSQWEEDNFLADHNSVNGDPDYNDVWTDLLQALAEIVGVKIEFDCPPGYARGKVVQGRVVPEEAHREAMRDGMMGDE